MRMPLEFAKQLMDDLAMLAVFANGRSPMTAEEIAETEDYARSTFLNLCEAWETEMNERFEVECEGV